jgi:hypothetical protein
VPSKSPPALARRIRDTLRPTAASRDGRTKEHVLTRGNSETRREDSFRRASPSRRDESPLRGDGFLTHPPSGTASASPWGPNLPNSYSGQPFSGSQYPGVPNLAYPQPRMMPGVYGRWPFAGPGMMMGHNGSTMIPVAAQSLHPQSRFAPSRAPPSPPRPPSIDPPSVNDSPPAGPMPLPPMSQGYGAGLLGVNTPTGMPSRPQQWLPLSNRGYPQKAWQQDQDLGRNRGMLNKLFGRGRNREIDRDEKPDGTKVNMWRSNIPLGRAPTEAPKRPPINDRSWFGRSRNGQDAVMDRPNHFWSRPRLNEGAFYDRQRTELSAGQRYTAAASRGTGRPLSTGFAPRGPSARPFGSNARAVARFRDPFDAERERLKEARRQEKIARRNRREARSKDSLRPSISARVTQAAQPLPPTPTTQRPREGRRVGFAGFSPLQVLSLGAIRGLRTNSRPQPQAATTATPQRSVRPAVDPMQSHYPEARTTGKVVNWLRGNPSLTSEGRPAGVTRKLSGKKWGDRWRERRMGKQ